MFMGKIRQLFVVVAVAISAFFLPGNAGAGSPRSQYKANPAVTIGKTKSFNGNVTKGSYTYNGSTACADGYAAQCPSTECECTTITGSFSNGTVGKGTITVELTGDHNPTAGAGDCWPLFVQGFINGSKDTMQFQANGSWCYSITSDGEPEIYIGGFDITHSNVVNGGAGQYTASVNFDNGAVKFSMKGKTF
jgi:hypothetical protein